MADTEADAVKKTVRVFTRRIVTLVLNKRPDLVLRKFMALPAQEGWRIESMVVIGHDSGELLMSLWRDEWRVGQ